MMRFFVLNLGLDNPFPVNIGLNEGFGWDALYTKDVKQSLWWLATWEDKQPKLNLTLGINT